MIKRPDPYEIYKKERTMLNKKILGYASILIVVFSFLHVNCKSHSTAPDVNELTRPVIWLDNFELSFAAYKNGPNPLSQIIQIKNSGQETLDYTLSSDADWVNILPESGSSSGQIIEHTISIDKSGLTVRKEAYTANITVVSSQAYNNPQNVEVSLTLSAEPPPEIWVSNQQLTFGAQEGGSNPASQPLKIRNNGEGTLNYQVTKNASWLSINPANGMLKTGERSHTVAVNITGLKAGAYNGTITVKDPKATNSPQPIDVILQISDKPEAPPPPPPPSTNNEVGISISPASGGTGTIVTVTISIKGNTSQISNGYGLDLQYDGSIFQYQSTSRGSLTNSWAAVDGGASSGKVTVGGFRGSGSIISTGSQGSIAVVKLKVIYSGTTDRSTQITVGNLVDDISGMTIKPSSAAFTYKH
jgi:hypothetical protein